MNNLALSLSVLCALSIGACGQSPNKSVVDKTSLSEQLNEVKAAKIPAIEDLPGSTNTERLLYLQGLPESVKSATLIVMDGQISTLEKAGKAKTANKLRNSRKLYIQAIDENMGFYVKGAAGVYDTFFSQEEVEQLLKIYNDPVMRKIVDSQISIQQEIIPVADAWTKKVVPRYLELLEQASND